ncbi:hypothetical protein MCOR25_008293 [Pyricularia grisea]|uniref:Uncharacterized protein n=1 Tax=Pyricularia grisea TaxID=148305 RepID=A0A6P8B0N7_PYRGI|nr:uncharacterized protein PgNI_07215 [Pyricularia grisea]KAI6355222.1 hypothetical protein MCOR25_008293 [Pyricularia grisea]TLD08278.1 hypothetical protein PgNI_07215 [Pyricularia grisea]
MASAARSRLPLALGVFTVVGGGLYWQTAGGRQQPKSRDDGNAKVSSTLQQIAGTGGPGARSQGDMQHDTKDTRIFSSSSDVRSKRNPDKERTGEKSQAAVLEDAAGDSKTAGLGGGGSGKGSSSSSSSSSKSGDHGSDNKMEGRPKRESEGLAWTKSGQSPKDGGSQSIKEDKPISQKEREQRASFSPAGGGAKTGTPKEKDSSSIPQGKNFAEPNRA